MKRSHCSSVNCSRTRKWSVASASPRCAYGRVVLDMEPIMLSGARVVTPGGGVEDGVVRVAGAWIAAVAAGRAPAGTMDLAGDWLVPGFVDQHVHGGGGA